MTRQVSLLVNDESIVLEDFVSRFIDHTISGMLASLKGTGEIESLDLAIEGNEVTIKLSNAIVPIKGFPHAIIKNTIVGMVSPLKGVRKMNEINKVNISITR